MNSNTFLVNHACGHIVRKTLYNEQVAGSHAEKAAWLEMRPCDDCQQGQRRLDVETWTVVRNLPALEGSEKQVAWAMKLRKQLVIAIESAIEAEAMNVITDKVERDYLAKRVLPVVLCQNKASWWISRQSASPKSIIRELTDFCRTRDAKKAVANAK